MTQITKKELFSIIHALIHFALLDQNEEFGYTFVSTSARVSNKFIDNNYIGESPHKRRLIFQ